MELVNLTTRPGVPFQGERSSNLFSHGQWRRLSARLGLSRRQSQIALRLCSERAKEDVARELGITAETVRTHTRALFHKLGVRSRVGLVIALVIESRQDSADEPVLDVLPFTDDDGNGKLHTA